MKYLLIMEQDGEGCDYTIGCGVKQVIFEVDSDAEAIQRTRQLLIHYLGDLASLREARLFPMFPLLALPIEEWRIEEQQKRAEHQKKVNEAYEKSEYQRLKAKFEGESS